ncbi:MAG: bis(5'-nucleosyl)-tetraphosphatase (symmetrical) YqeK [Clostridia bacterium]|nr:bis(5'-nucleosyl)-tetraphosphatase (symmetrical) YqeK [Clostridia bacterium]
MTEITDSVISRLREYVTATLSHHRAQHTFGVERTAVHMAELLLPEKIADVRCAALLHDITKEFNLKKHLQIIQECGIIISDDYKTTPSLLHAITATAVIPSIFPELATDEILSAVRWHTTGKPDMSVMEKIIFLADFIEDGRTYESCLRVREYYLSADMKGMTLTQRLHHLDLTTLECLDSMIRVLERERVLVCPDSTEARDALKLSLMKGNKNG